MSCFNKQASICMNMSSQNHPDHDHKLLQVFFLPFLNPGHMIPMVDVARLFAAAISSVNVTIITTTHNALLFKSSIDEDIKSGHNIKLHILKFPSSQVGLPEGIENFTSITSQDMFSKLYQGISILQQPIERFLEESNPDCIVSDMFYPWTVDLAEKLNCPRLVFHGSNFFASCVMDSITTLKPHETVSSDTEPFIIPNVPNQIQMTRLQLPDHVITRTEYTELMDLVKESEKRSYGVIMNSFYELESAYVDHFRNVMGRKAWPVGPLSIRVKRSEENQEEIRHDCLNWLDSKEPNSVLYVSFGSLARFPTSQLIEIASGLEASGHPFIWVVRKREKSKEDENEEEKLMTKEYEKGLIIRGWAPQVAILAHPAIGGFVTHCGWNSVLESVCAGVPMIAWPLMAEQFCNEKCITQVLKIGVGVGVEEWSSLMEEGKNPVKREKIKNVVKSLMDGDNEEAERIRKRANEVAEMANKAVAEGGSSYTTLVDLIEELKAMRCDVRHPVVAGRCLDYDVRS